MDEKLTSFDFTNYIIKSNVNHQLKCDQHHLIILLSPVSSIGNYFWCQSKMDISPLKHEIVEKLQHYSIDYLAGSIDFKSLTSRIKFVIDSFTSVLSEKMPIKDDRISWAMSYLEMNFERIVPVEEIAAKCHLSSSRFLHLFKEKTGITYRKVQQWNKVSQSFNMLSKQSITKTANQFGFTDSAHYSKVFKQTFGFNPKSIQKT